MQLGSNKKGVHLTDIYYTYHRNTISVRFLMTTGNRKTSTGLLVSLSIVRVVDVFKLYLAACYFNEDRLQCVNLINIDSF